jgi:hypothetical protein
MKIFKKKTATQKTPKNIDTIDTIDIESLQPDSAPPEKRQGNHYATRNVIPEDERLALKHKAFELSLEGHNFAEIGRALKISPVTAQKYFVQLVVELDSKQDYEFLLKREQARTERMYNKAILRYYEGKYTPMEVAVAAKLANKWNGLDAYLEKVDPTPATALLKVEVTQVPIQLPPAPSAATVAEVE